MEQASRRRAVHRRYFGGRGECRRSLQDIDAANAKGTLLGRIPPPAAEQGFGGSRKSANDQNGGRAKYRLKRRDAAGGQAEQAPPLRGGVIFFMGVASEGASGAAHRPEIRTPQMRGAPCLVGASPVAYRGFGGSSESHYKQKGGAE